MDLRLPPLLQATSGALGSVIGKSIVFPLDSAVTRIQHVRPKDNAQKLSLISTLYRITQRKGLSALYAGFSADTLSTLLSSFIYFYLYSYLHKVALRRTRAPTVLGSPAGIGGMTAPASHQPARGGGSGGGSGMIAGKLGAGEELLIGLLSGVISKGVVLPISAVCVRQQLASDNHPSTTSTSSHSRPSGHRHDHDHGHSGRSLGLVDSLQAIHREEGILGLWSALPPSIPLALLPSLTLYIHTLLLRLLLPAKHRAYPTGAVTFFIGAASNALATIPLYPMVLIKALSQSGASKGSQVDTLRRIWEEGGVRGMYRGVEGQLVKGFVQQGVMMLLKQRIEEGIVRAYKATM